VGYQVYLQEARAFIIPIGEGANGYGRLGQASWLGGAKGPPLATVAVRAQQSVYGGWTQAAELVLYFRGHRQFTMPLQHLDQFWEEGLQSAGVLRSLASQAFFSAATTSKPYSLGRPRRYEEPF
jgi:hypothetical protein